MFRDNTDMPAGEMESTYRFRQCTPARPVSCIGTGLHTGERVSLTLKPARPNTGILFLRTDVAPPETASIPARWSSVVDTMFNTTIGNAAGHRISTIEHMMAALHAMGIDNALIEVDAPELPAMDGSAAPFLRLIQSAGIQTLPAPRYAIKVLKPVTVTEGNKTATLGPAESGLSLTCDIDFCSDVIGAQSRTHHLTPETFRQDVASARTFGFLRDVETLKANGLARGGSLDNAVVVDESRILNEDGLRFPDEFVRHKILDAVGDLYTAGHSMIAAFHGVHAGHTLHKQLLATLLMNDSAWRFVACDDLEPERPALATA